jgi:NADH:ubiquinone oxidoreductase subunit 5 (subunit L)/multisubunit Na+/H+ antiporter MnhA subunit
MVALAIIGIIYGALVCMVQPDLKRLIAFSSVSHLGFVMLGIFAFNLQALQGSLIQMVNHGLSTGALFLLVGMIYERRHTRLIADFGGLAGVMPILAACFMVVALSSVGLPGLNGFVGEFLILLGAFQARPLYGVLAATGVILAAAYMLWMFQRVMFGEVTHEENRGLPDLSLREGAVLAPLLLLIVWIGVYPSSFLAKTEPSAAHFLKGLSAAMAAAEEGPVCPVQPLPENGEPTFFGGPASASLPADDGADAQPKGVLSPPPQGPAPLGRVDEAPLTEPAARPPAEPEAETGVELQSGRDILPQQPAAAEGNIDAY